MSTPDDDALAGLCAPARRLVQAELAAGNRVLQVIAPPQGVRASHHVLMDGPLRTAGGPGPRGFGELAPGVPEVVVLGAEPFEHDPPPASDSAEAATVPRPTPGGRDAHRAPPARPDESPRVARFRASLAIDADAWRDGIGYDLEAIALADAGERAAMPALLRDGPMSDWRDVQALAALGGEEAHALLRRCWREGDDAVRMAVLRHAPQLVTPAQREDALVRALAHSSLFAGLSECLDEVLISHPPRVMDALWQAVRTREPAVAVHCAALLAHLHGLADAPFDLAQRPFFLRCGSEDAAERAQALAELRARIDAASGRGR